METDINFSSLDGLELAGSLAVPAGATRGVVLLHGLGGDRQETGIYAPLAAALQARGLATLRFELRCHGRSGGGPDDLVLSGCVNDARAAMATLRRRAGIARVDLVGTSFGGGIAVAAALREPGVEAMALIAPRIDYGPWVRHERYWCDDGLSDRAKAEMAENGCLLHNGHRVVRAMLNEILLFDGLAALCAFKGRVLICHGDADDTVPISGSIAAAKAHPGTRLVTLQGAMHGLADPSDPQVTEAHRARANALIVELIAG